jgi:hypothetical protein
MMQSAAVRWAAVGLVLAAAAGGGCRSAMLGPAYKRLIPVYTEANALTNELDRLEAAERANRATDERLADIRAVRHDAATYRDRTHKALDRRQRVFWHRVQMDQLWDRAAELDGSIATLADSYRSERTVDWDEFNNRRTPLTFDQPRIFGGEPRDQLPY